MLFIKARKLNDLLTISLTFIKNKLIILMQPTFCDKKNNFSAKVINPFYNFPMNLE